jgi:succinate dehydrogenase / fumarate reductase cytochrome b subunit
MSELTKPARPVYRNIHVTQLAGYRLPLAGIVSILHRISGALLFLFLPFLLYLLDKSLISEIGFEKFKSFTSNILVKLILLALIWAFLHHLMAGIRFLLLDMHYGLEKEKAKQSSIVVLAVSLPLTALIALKLFGVF